MGNEFSAPGSQAGNDGVDVLGRPHHSNELKIQVRSSVAHTFTVKRMEAWVQGTCRSPATTTQGPAEGEMADPH